MTDEQRDILDSFNRVNDYNIRYAAALHLIEGHDEVRLLFEGYRNAILEESGIQVVDSSGESPEALVLKNEMARVTLKYAKKGRVKSRLAAANVLTAKLTHPKTFITSADKLLAIQNATNIKTALADNLLICTNVTPLNIAEIMGTITAYTNQKDKAVEAIQTKKAHGTDLLPENFTNGTAQVINQYDLVDAEWTDTVDSPKVGELAIAKEVIITGHHDIKANFNLVKFEDDTPIDGHVVDQSNDKSYDSDDTHVVHIIHHRTGHFHFTVSAPSRVPVDFIADIHRGVNTFTVKLRLI